MKRNTTSSSIIKVNRLKDKDLDKKLKKLAFQKDSKFYRELLKEKSLRG